MGKTRRKARKGRMRMMARGRIGVWIGRELQYIIWSLARNLNKLTTKEVDKDL